MNTQLDSAVASLQGDNRKKGSNNNSKDGEFYSKPSNVVVVILCHSSAFAEIAAALKQWLMKENEISPTASMKLCEAVIVVTFGSTSKRLPCGPKCIHVSMKEDLVNEDLGISSSSSSKKLSSNNNSYNNQNQPKYNNDNDTVFLHGYFLYYYHKTMLGHINKPKVGSTNVQ